MEKCQNHPSIPTHNQVPAFSVQSMQPNTRPFSPPAARCRHQQNTLKQQQHDYCVSCSSLTSSPFASQSAASLLNCPQVEQSLRQFVRFYDAQKFPVRITDVPSGKGSQQDRKGQGKKHLEWKIPPQELNADDRQELIRRFAIGLPVEKQVGPISEFYGQNRINK